jgi:hypothetical protein
MSSEKDHMQLPEKGAQNDRQCPELGRVIRLDRSLRCVWSSYPTYDRCCPAQVPAAVVSAAWGRELEHGHHEGFFHFSWRGGAWLAYGLADGGVRGVYCSAHRAEREQRLGYDPQLAPVAAEHVR